MKKNLQQGDNSPNLVTLFLMTEKGYEFLRGITGEYKSLLHLVVVGSDKSLKKDFEREILDFCFENHINVVRHKEFQRIESKYVLCISWRWLINHPAERLIVLHDSLLPKYRGFSPLVNSLINGETEIGVSAIFGDINFDIGDVIFQSKSIINYPIKISHAIEINNINYIKCGKFVFDSILNGLDLQGVKQDEALASYSIWRDEADYEIDWRLSAKEIQRFIDAVGFPYKGAAAKMDDQVVRILSSEVVLDVKVEGRHYGKVLFITDEGAPVVICGKGLLKITDAYIEVDGEEVSLFPLSRFRIRFS